MPTAHPHTPLATLRSDFHYACSMEKFQYHVISILRDGGTEILSTLNKGWCREAARLPVTAVTVHQRKGGGGVWSFFSRLAGRRGYDR